MKKIFALALTAVALTACSETTTIMEPEEVEQPFEIPSCVLTKSTGEDVTIAACVPMYYEGERGWLDADCDFNLGEMPGDYDTCIKEW